MAKYYSAPAKMKNGTVGQATCIGNNAAWTCPCGTTLLGPHEAIYLVDPCPTCSRNFRVRRGAKPQFVSMVEEV
jgi:hypothetical protein